MTNIFYFPRPAVRIWVIIGAQTKAAAWRDLWARALQSAVKLWLLMYVAAKTLI